MNNRKLHKKSLLVFIYFLTTFETCFSDYSIRAQKFYDKHGTVLYKYRYKLLSLTNDGVTTDNVLVDDDLLPSLSRNEAL